MTVDLHIHTTKSDGLRTPEQTVLEAVSKKMKAIAITDHDITLGVEEAIKIAENYELKVIPGVEINSCWQGEEIHILGYYIDTSNDRLQSKLSIIRKSREERASRIICRLQELNYEISLEEVINLKGIGTIGRPHIARLLVRKGYFRNTNEAFDKLLSPGKAAYVDRLRLEPQEAIELIHNAKGLAVVAHPGLYDNAIDWGYFAELGLDGIEVYHSKHDYRKTEKYKDIATKFSLLETGGSDCHGIGTSSILNLLKLPYEIVDRLEAAKMDSLK
ncbi:PHP domain-containing protein [Desulfuribacillus alkaliarsenatis]|uniref:Polymerase/histidinol phosphatase N-terminal domain-containing protein n=1 Tax=Desulfuribacillus alkaliarsenatis TaxID=766136 RepID=A0A1E5G677_9FIRM|nr:PHP domain-containing protein [Desulfuribacillus alkaliarsenatis]OEF98682.1 hypothetical protein BHF68_03205 [Desulfuribacillus alkaliarsenatis]